MDEAPDLAAAPAAVALALGASAWARYQPDRFDVYSAGVVFMQLCLPSLRSDRGLKAFNELLREQPGHRLDGVRAQATGMESRVLDAHGGAGWELAEALLAPRPSDWAQQGLLGSLSGGRPSAEAALGMRFFTTQARKVAPGVQSAAQAAQRRLSLLEVAVTEQGREVSETRMRLARLQEQQAAAPPAPALQAEEERLVQQSSGLEGLFSRFALSLQKMLQDGGVVVPSAPPLPPPSVRVELAAEGAPEDTPRPPPRDAAEAARPVDPPSSAAALADELEAVSARLAVMQRRMAALLAENEAVLSSFEGKRSGGDADSAASAASAVSLAAAKVAAAAAAAERDSAPR